MFLGKTGLMLSLILILTPVKAAVNLEKIGKTKWIEVSSENFRIITDAKPKLAKTFAQHLEDYRLFISAVLEKNFFEGVPPLTILAPQKSSTWKALDLPETWGGAFKRDFHGATVIANLRRYSPNDKSPSYGNVILMHEYVHYAMRNLEEIRYYPLWYSEGLAEYFSTYRKYSKRIQIGNFGVLKYGLRNLTNNSGTRFLPIDVEDLLKTRRIKSSWRGEKNSKEKRQGEADFSKFYSRSIVAMHYLRSSRELKKSLEDYIQFINNGYSVDAAFDKAFSMTYSEFDNKIIDYLSGKKISGWSYKIGEGGINFPEQDAIIRPLETNEIYEKIVLTLARFNYQKKQERQEMIDFALDKNPESLPLKEYIWLSKSSDLFNPYNNNHHSAVKKLDALLNEHPKNVVFLTLKGSQYHGKGILLKKSGLSGHKALFHKARQYYRKAIKAAPLEGRGYDKLGSLYLHLMDEEDKYIEEGRISIESARYTGPSEYYSHSLTYREALFNLRLGRPDQALPLLRLYISAMHFTKQHFIEFFLTEGLEILDISNKRGTQNETGVVFENGSIYTGRTKGGLPSGKGVLKHISGSTIEGTWVNGKLAGQGTFTTSSSFRYEGTFLEGAATGHGRLYYPQSSYIEYTEGHFYYGLPHGKQKTVFRSGAEQSGNWEYGKMSGDFSVVTPSGKKLNVYKYNLSNKIPIGRVHYYIGNADEEYRPSGRGICFDSQKKQFSRCKYKNGNLVK